MTGHPADARRPGGRARRPGPRARARPPDSALFAVLPYPDWLSGRGVLVAIRLQREHPRSVGLPDALRTWSRLVRERVGRVDPGMGCGGEGCCPDVGELHEVLRTALRALPARDARRLRRRLRAMPHRWPTPSPWERGTWFAYTPLEGPPEP